MMEKSSDLTLSAFDLLIRIFDQPDMVVSHGVLVSCFSGETVDVLIRDWLIPFAGDGINDLSVLPDSSSCLFWDEDACQFKYFSAIRGWIYLSPEFSLRYTLNRDRFLLFLQSELHIGASWRVVCLCDDFLWYLGQTMTNVGCRVHFYFVRHLDRFGGYVRFLRAMRSEMQKQPAVIIHSCRRCVDFFGLFPRQVMISVFDLLSRNQDVFQFDADVLCSLIETDNNCRLTVASRFSGLQFSPDYRSVCWRGETYHLTRKQAVIFGCLCKSGGRISSRQLQDFTRCSDRVCHIMRNKRNGQWVPHPLLNTLIKYDGHGFYFLDP